RARRDRGARRQPVVLARHRPKRYGGFRASRGRTACPLRPGPLPYLHAAPARRPRPCSRAAGFGLMHLELVVPGLLGGGADAPRPALELLRARGRATQAERLALEDWLKDGFNLEKEQGLPAGALSALALGVDPGDRFWLRADPVHLRADRDRLLLFPSPAFAI